MKSVCCIRQYIICLLPAVIILAFSAYSSSAVIEGVVLSDSGPLEDSVVSAYRSFQEVVDKKPAYVSVRTEKEGFFTLELPPGKYYLDAAAQSGEMKFYAYHGANPIDIEENDLWIPFMMVPATADTVKNSEYTALTGHVTFKGEPVKGAQVSIYPLNDLKFRGMGFLTSTTGTMGEFRISPIAGEYVVVARKRMEQGRLRPLIKGDLFCYPSSNPVSVKSMHETVLEIPCYPKDDLSAFLNMETYPDIHVKKSGEKSIRFREKKIFESKGLKSIQGTVSDLSGNPMKDIYVMAYRGKASSMFQMLDVRTMPEYLVKTDGEGRFSISTDEKGTYYMLARELIGDSPAKGENYGLYEGNTDHAITIDSNSVSNVNIIVSPVMGNSDSGQGTEGYMTGARVRNYAYSADTVIYSDTVWSGYIIVKGTVHVGRSATLTIEPGTVIFFEKRDSNKDGVGDSKIRVSGRLVAEGTGNNMIRFTSAEDRPRKMDWSFVLFFVSGEDNIVKYCKFEYAFTGVQVHFSKASVSDSLFINNHEGIRFGRTELSVRHNNLTSNSYGIRYTRMEGPVLIEYNSIGKNGTGIFHVPSNQNIVDFSDTFVREDSLHDHQPVVRHNNISYNYEYNFRLGERQGYNILLKDNWWGSVSGSNIDDLLYDARKDSSLGKIIYKPYMKSPVKDAGVRRGG